MAFQHVRLALLIPVLGLGVSAVQRAHAEGGCEAPAVARTTPGEHRDPPCAEPLSAHDVRGILLSLGLDSGLPYAAPAGPAPERLAVVARAPAASVPPAHPDATRLAPSEVQRAIWALGIDAGTPARQLEPEPIRHGAPPMAVARRDPPPAPAPQDVEPTAAAAAADPDAMWPAADWRADLLPPDATEPFGSLIALESTDPFEMPQAPTKAPPPDVKTLAPREPSAPRRDGDGLLPVQEDPPSAGDPMRALFAAMGGWWRTVFDGAPGQVAQAVAEDAGYVGPAAALMGHGVAPLARTSGDADGGIVVASHTDRVLMSLQALLTSDNELGSAQPRQVVVATEAERVLATLAEMKRESRERYVQEKRAAAGARAASEGEPAAEARPDASAVRLAIAGTAASIGEDQLDRVRGGFIADNGLQISFGITRAVYINGVQLEPTVPFNFSIGGAGAPADAAGQVAPGEVHAIQNGAGNTVITGLGSAGGVPMVIQNSLDGQTIQNLTIINATVNSLQVLKGLQLQTSLNSAIAASLRR